MRIFKSMSEVVQANTAAGYFFFAKETMTRFGSKVETPLMNGKYFITSETLGYSTGKRGFAIREVQENTTIRTVERYDTLEDAKGGVDKFP